MSLNTLIAADAVNVIANADDFGEAATYEKYNASSRAITAVVVERGTYVEPQTNRPRRSMVVQVPNHATLGILASEIDFDRDRFSIAYAVGDAAQSWSFVKHLEGSDAGMIRVRLV